MKPTKTAMHKVLLKHMPIEAYRHGPKVYLIIEMANGNLTVKAEYACGSNIGEVERITYPESEFETLAGARFAILAATLEVLT